MKKPIGWRNDRMEHGLAAKGVKTKISFSRIPQGTEIVSDLGNAYVFIGKTENKGDYWFFNKTNGNPVRLFGSVAQTLIDHSRKVKFPWGTSPHGVDVTELEMREEK